MTMCKFIHYIPDMKNRLTTSLLLILVAISSGYAQKINFSPYFVAAESFESVAAIDVNNDGLLDLVSGDFWYENNGLKLNNFRKRYSIGDQKRHGEYYDDFSTIPFDVNQDGFMDFITGGWFEATIRWHQNPGDKKDQTWIRHDVVNTGNIECMRAYDLDGDGIIEVIPNNPNKPLKYFKIESGEFKQFDVAPSQGHGIGFGDINNDGNVDIIVTKGWLQNPGSAGNWILHEEFDLETASVPILVHDVNLDGKNDLIVGQGHAYGLHWYEQLEGKKWKKHIIDNEASQYHTMELADLNNDGKQELITGKRYRAHNGKDPGGLEDLGLYYYKIENGTFIKNTITYGAPGIGKGTGTTFAIADLLGNGKKDLIFAGKDGLTIFYNE
ncbi:Repeat domain-containing protein [Spirosomataceae bacterium TFI 002]|nr:Repeat domain-containing protein [Spirosomataceae bacterium TFI 002]